MSSPRRVCVVVGDQAISPDARGGGSALVYSHLEMLAAAKCEIALAVLTDAAAGEFSRFAADPESRESWSTVRGWCSEVVEIPLTAAPRESAPWRHAYLAASDPSRFLFASLSVDAPEAAALAEFLGRAEPDLIWAEHLLPALLSLRARTGVPVVYSHHDWEWRLMGLRRGAGGSSWRERVASVLMRRVEHEAVRSAAACVSASAVETRELELVGARRAVYLPTTYSGSPVRDLEIASTARVVHLGGMRTTASREGLTQFLQSVWPRVESGGGERPELWVVGDPTGMPPTLQAALERCGARCTGFVRDLDAVLRPGDVHVIPWDHATGTRTRVPVALRHAQVLVATRATAEALPELRDGVNARIVDGLPAMAGAIQALVSDAGERRRLAQAARATFEASFTRAALQPRLERLLDSFPARSRRAPARQVTA